MSLSLKIATIIFLTQFSNFSFCQIEANNSVKQGLTIPQIDSIATSIDSNQNLHRSSAEGEYSYKNGGWTTYYLSDRIIGGTLYRTWNQSSTSCSYTFNQYCTTTTVFYYYNQMVVKATFTIDDYSENRRRTFYSATYYFFDSKLLKALGDDPRYSNAADILRQGINYSTGFHRLFSQ